MNRPVLIAIIVAVLALVGAFFASRQASAPEVEDQTSLETTEQAGSSGSATQGMPVPEGEAVMTPEMEVLSTPAPKPVTTPAAESPKVKGYTMAEVSSRNTTSSCWSVVNGQVYDLTSWIAKHPGGEKAIEGMCGKDASAAFGSQHGGEPKPEAVLAGFLIGALAN